MMKFISSWVALVIIGVGSVVAIFVFIPRLHEAEVRRLCDVSVQTVLTSHDLVELQRAAILIDRLDCSVRSRLPDDQR
jgi:hypothetical protein